MEVFNSLYRVSSELLYGTLLLLLIIMLLPLPAMPAYVNNCITTLFAEDVLWLGAVP